MLAQTLHGWQGLAPAGLLPAAPQTLQEAVIQVKLLGDL
jgi:hypothetical protein